MENVIWGFAIFIGPALVMGILSLFFELDIEDE